MVDLDKLLELEKISTPGPWGWVEAQHNSNGKHLMPFESYHDIEISDVDIELLAATRNSIKELCLELKAAREYIAEMQNYLLGREGLPSWIEELKNKYDVTAKKEI